MKQNERKFLFLYETDRNEYKAVVVCETNMNANKYDLYKELKEWVKRNNKHFKIIEITNIEPTVSIYPDVEIFDNYVQNIFIN